jgi:hypothetical protein
MCRAPRVESDGDQPAATWRCGILIVPVRSVLVVPLERRPFERIRDHSARNIAFHFNPRDLCEMPDTLGATKPNRELFCLLDFGHVFGGDD